MVFSSSSVENISYLNVSFIPLTQKFLVADSNYPLHTVFVGTYTNKVCFRCGAMSTSQFGRYHVTVETGAMILRTSVLHLTSSKAVLFKVPTAVKCQLWPSDLWRREDFWLVRKFPGGGGYRPNLQREVRYQIAIFNTKYVSEVVPAPVFTRLVVSIPTNICVPFFINSPKPHVLDPHPQQPETNTN